MEKNDLNVNETDQIGESPNNSSSDSSFNKKSQKSCTHSDKTFLSGNSLSHIEKTAQGSKTVELENNLDYNKQENQFYNALDKLKIVDEIPAKKFSRLDIFKAASTSKTNSLYSEEMIINRINNNQVPKQINSDKINRYTEFHQPNPFNSSKTNNVSTNMGSNKIILQNINPLYSNNSIYSCNLYDNPLIDPYFNNSTINNHIIHDPQTLNNCFSNNIYDYNYSLYNQYYQPNTNLLNSNNVNNAQFPKLSSSFKLDNININNSNFLSDNLSLEKSKVKRNSFKEVSKVNTANLSKTKKKVSKKVNDIMQITEEQPSLSNSPTNEYISNNFLSLAKDQEYSKYLQNKISNDSEFLHKTIFPIFIGSSTELCNDYFGNYLVQKIIEKCNKTEFKDLFYAVSKFIT